MKMTDHLLGDRVSVRCRFNRLARASGAPSAGPALAEAEWLGGQIIARDVQRAERCERTRYVVQLDDNRRVVAYDDDVRRWTLSFELFDRLEKMAS